MSRLTRWLVVIGLLNVLAGGASFLYSSMTYAQAHSEAVLGAERASAGQAAVLGSAGSLGRSCAAASAMLVASGTACLVLAWQSHAAPGRVRG